MVCEFCTPEKFIPGRKRHCVRQDSCPTNALVRKIARSAYWQKRAPRGQEDLNLYPVQNDAVEKRHPLSICEIRRRFNPIGEQRQIQRQLADPDAYLCLLRAGDMDGFTSTTGRVLLG